MKHFETNWKTSSGGSIFSQGWEADTVQPQGVICLVHGVGEHTGRYAHVGSFFCKSGFHMMGFDLRGHGRSDGARGHMDSIEDFMQDIDTLIAQARARYPGLPVILYGHSLGGILVLYYGLKRKPEIKGVVATSAGLRTAVENQPVKVAAARALGSLLPSVAIPSGLETAAISRDPKVVERYLADPLVHDKLSLGFGKIMLGVTRWTLEHAAEFSLPLLLMHGKADRIAFPEGSIQFANALKDKCTLVLWDNAYHELHNEPEKEEALRTMLLWVEARIRES